MSFPCNTPAHLILDSRATAVFLSSVPLISQALEFVTHATAAGWYFTIPVPIFSFLPSSKEPTKRNKSLVGECKDVSGAGYVPQVFASTKKAIPTLHGWLFHYWENILRSSTWEQSILQLYQQCSSRDQTPFEQKHSILKPTWN